MQNFFGTLGMKSAGMTEVMEWRKATKKRSMKT